MLRIGENWFVLHASIQCIEKNIKSEPADESEPQIFWQSIDSTEPNPDNGTEPIDFLNCDQNSDVGSEHGFDSFDDSASEDLSAKDATNIATDIKFEAIDENSVDKNSKEPNGPKRKAFTKKIPKKRPGKEKKIKKEKHKKPGEKVYSCDICVRTFAR